MQNLSPNILAHVKPGRQQTFPAGVPGQHVVEPGQQNDPQFTPHTPEQHNPVVHTVPQAPQFEASKSRFVQVPPQFVSPGGQMTGPDMLTHFPFWQDSLLLQHDSVRVGLPHPVIERWQVESQGPSSCWQGSLLSQMVPPTLMVPPIGAAGSTVFPCAESMLYKKAVA
jgi:hypothetical protein